MNLFAKICSIAGLLLLLGPYAVQAQHSDIDFEYEMELGGGHIHIDGGPVFEAAMPTTGIFARRTSDPGFESHVPIGAGDVISYNVLDNLYYWNPTTQAFADPGLATITIDNAIASDTMVGAGTGIQIPGGVIGQAGSLGDFHSHVDFELSSSAAFGAYGLLLELATDQAGIANSDSFFVVFNYGVDETTFDLMALPAFEQVLAVPEPSSLVLSSFGIALLGFVGWKRRRQAA